MKRIEAIIFNDDGTVRWHVLIEDQGKYYTVSEVDSSKSLFRNPLSFPGLTPGQALNNFLAVEDELLKSL